MAHALKVMYQHALATITIVLFYNLCNYITSNLLNICKFEWSDEDNANGVENLISLLYYVTSYSSIIFTKNLYSSS